MGLPKRKVSHARQGDRRAHHALTLPDVESCSHCREPKQIHHVCPSCGYYNGRPTVDVKSTSESKS